MKETLKLLHPEMQCYKSSQKSQDQVEKLIDNLEMKTIWELLLAWKLEQKVVFELKNTENSVMHFSADIKEN
jgi:NAD(P)H-nitrite reductase large subunit